MNVKFKFRNVIEIVPDDAANGEQIRKLRVSREKSLRWLAKQLGISPPYLSDMEKGKRSMSLEWFNKALDFLF